MSEAWRPEITVSTELARALLERQFPEILPASIRELAAGWDNTAFLVDERWVFRFPRRAVAAELLRVEAQALPAIAGHLPVPVPEPRFLGEPDRDYPWPFLGYARLPGCPACRARLDHDARAALAEPLADLLRRLHSVPPSALDAIRLPPDRLRRLDVARRREATCRRLATLVATEVIDSARPWERVLDRAPRVPDDEPRALVHGDLYSCHLLLDDVGGLCGLIDWGDVHRGRPAVDLAVAHSLLPAAAREVFRIGYGEVTEVDWELARARALNTAVALTAYAHDTGDRGLLQEGIVAMENVLQ